MSTIVNNRYEIQAAIGVGNYGKVFRARDVATNQLVALKELFSWVLFNRELWYFIQLEIGILTSCNNPNIVKLYEHFPSSDKYYLVYEICSDGDLKNLIEKDGKMTESATLEIVGQMALALIYLSEKQIIHRDIKPENIFIQSGVAKLGDFGLCERGTIEIRHAMVGSPAFQAPETHARHEYSQACDLYSLGMCMYEMLMGDIPFTIDDINNLLERKTTLVQRIKDISGNRISEQTMSLLKKMLDPNPRTRITCYQLRDQIQRIVANPAICPSSSMNFVKEQKPARNTSTNQSRRYFNVAEDRGASVHSARIGPSQFKFNPSQSPNKVISSAQRIQSSQITQNIAHGSDSVMQPRRITGDNSTSLSRAATQDKSQSGIQILQNPFSNSNNQNQPSQREPTTEIRRDSSPNKQTTYRVERVTSNTTSFPQQELRHIRTERSTSVTQPLAQTQGSLSANIYQLTSSGQDSQTSRAQQPQPIVSEHGHPLHFKTDQHTEQKNQESNSVLSNEIAKDNLQIEKRDSNQTQTKDEQKNPQKTIPFAINPFKDYPQSSRQGNANQMQQIEVHDNQLKTSNDTQISNSLPNNSNVSTTIFEEGSANQNSVLPSKNSAFQIFFAKRGASGTNNSVTSSQRVVEKSGQSFVQESNPEQDVSQHGISPTGSQHIQQGVQVTMSDSKPATQIGSSRREAVTERKTQPETRTNITAQALLEKYQKNKVSDFQRVYLPNTIQGTHEPSQHHAMNNQPNAGSHPNLVYGVPSNIQVQNRPESQNIIQRSNQTPQEFKYAQFIASVGNTQPQSASTISNLAMQNDGRSGRVSTQSVFQGTNTNMGLLNNGSSISTSYGQNSFANQQSTMQPQRYQRESTTRNFVVDPEKEQYKSILENQKLREQKRQAGELSRNNSPLQKQYQNSYSQPSQYSEIKKTAPSRLNLNSSSNRHTNEVQSTILKPGHLNPVDFVSKYSYNKTQPQVNLNQSLQFNQFNPNSQITAQNMVPASSSRYSVQNRNSQTRGTVEDIRNQALNQSVPLISEPGYKNFQRSFAERSTRLSDTSNTYSESRRAIAYKKQKNTNYEPTILAGSTGFQESQSMIPQSLSQNQTKPYYQLYLQTLLNCNQAKRKLSMQQVSPTTKLSSNTISPLNKDCECLKHPQYSWSRFLKVQSHVIKAYDWLHRKLIFDYFTFKSADFYSGLSLESIKV